MIFHTLTSAIKEATSQLINHGEEVASPRWQGMDTNRNLYEVFEVSIKGLIPQTIEELAQQCSPNLPWAENHFQERVSGTPANPGKEYLNWPHYPHNNDAQIKPEKFTHTYMERFWPKFAGERIQGYINSGIRYEYGDLNDVINLLYDEPDTRQAFLPIWFPEDTGVVHRGRVPCTLGYLFYMRKQMLHCTYYIRSCDYYRHFRDDIYMAGRLVQWVIEELRRKTVANTINPWWTIRPGNLTMHIGSLHIFAKEQGILLKSK